MKLRLRLLIILAVVIMALTVPTLALAERGGMRGQGGQPAVTTFALADIDLNPIDDLIEWVKKIPEAMIEAGQKWVRQKTIEYDREAHTPFLYALPMLLKYTPDLNSGVVKIIHDSFVSIGLGVASLLFGIGWLQATGGDWIGSPLTPKQLVARFALAVLLVKSCGAILLWMLKLNDLIIMKLALDFDAQVFAPAIQDGNNLNIIMLGLGIVFRFVSIVGIWGLLVYRVVDLALLFAMAPLPAAFTVLPSTSGLTRTFLTEFIAVATQTILFTVLLTFWTANQLWNVDGLPLTWFQNTAATALLWGYLRKKPEWLRGLLHSAAWNYAGTVAMAGQQAISTQ